MDIKKIIVVAVVLTALGGAGFAAYTNLVAAKEVTVSNLKGNPANYLGRIEVTGKAGRVYADQGVIEMVDEKACCSVYLTVPQNDEQGKALKTADRFSGRFPAQGDAITAVGELSQNADGYFIRVKEVRSGSAKLIARI